ncbi:MAG: ABC transporter permease [Chloroflexi bacterium]|nr:ABC transporter permease [Chloroflexota bacterium]
MRAIGAQRLIDPLPIYTMWLREMKRFLRVKARIVSSILMPLFFLAFLGLPMSFVPVRQIPGLEGIGYLDFLAPGIVGMTLLFAGTMSGASVIWDKEFGFLKEVLVAPVSRFSVILGRSLGGITTTIVQALIIVGIAVAMGVKLSSVPGFFLAILIMILTCAAFTGFGLIIATKLGNLEGFMAIMNLIVFPIFLLSGAMFPVQAMPSWLKYIMYINPLTYGVDGLRHTLIGVAAFPLWLDFTVLLIVCLALATLGSYFFSKMEAD